MSWGYFIVFIIALILLTYTATFGGLYAAGTIEVNNFVWMTIGMSLMAGLVCMYFVGKNAMFTPLKSKQENLISSRNPPSNQPSNQQKILTNASEQYGRTPASVSNPKKIINRASTQYGTMPFPASNQYGSVPQGLLDTESVPRKAHNKDSPYGSIPAKAKVVYDKFIPENQYDKVDSSIFDPMDELSGLPCLQEKSEES